MTKQTHGPVRTQSMMKKAHGPLFMKVIYDQNVILSIFAKG